MNYATNSEVQYIIKKFNLDIHNKKQLIKIFNTTTFFEKNLYYIYINKKLTHYLKLFIIKNYKQITPTTLLQINIIINDIIDYNYIFNNIDFFTLIKLHIKLYDKTILFSDELLNTHNNSKIIYYAVYKKNKQLFIKKLIYQINKQFKCSKSFLIKLYDFINLYNTDLTAIFEFFKYTPNLLTKMQLLFIIFSKTEFKYQFFKLFDKYIIYNQHTCYSLAFIDYKKQVLGFMNYSQLNRFIKTLINTNNDYFIDEILSIKYQIRTKEKINLLNNLYMYKKLKGEK